jgi:hypothetical protein
VLILFFWIFTGVSAKASGNCIIFPKALQSVAISQIDAGTTKITRGGPHGHIHYPDERRTIKNQ